MTGYFDAAPRPLRPSDAESVRALILSALGVTPYVDRVLERLAAAERGEPETQGLVVERDGTVAALVLLGPVAGAHGAWQLAALVTAAPVGSLEVGRALVDAALAAVRDAGGRFLLAELPADPVIGSSLTTLRKSGFRQVGRIPDFFRDNVALLFLRRDL